MASAHHSALMVWLDVFRVALLSLWCCLVLLLRRVVGRVPRKSLRGNVVLLTGAGQGLGRHLALELAREGCVVACVDVNQTQNEETVELVRALAKDPAAARSYTADLGDRAQAYGVVRKVQVELGRVDILFSNAALIFGKSLLAYTDEEIDATIDVNLKATIWLVRAVLPGMREQGSGHIVSMSSATAFQGIVNRSVYGASKGGITSFMEALEEEIVRVGREPIALTTVHPNVVNTSPLIERIVKTRLPFMDADVAARGIVEAIMEQKSIVVLPAPITLMAAVLWLLPRSAINHVRDVFYTYTVDMEGNFSQKPAFSVGDDRLTEKATKSE